MPPRTVPDQVSGQLLPGRFGADNGCLRLLGPYYSSAHEDAMEREVAERINASKSIIRTHVEALKELDVFVRVSVAGVGFGKVLMRVNEALDGEVTAATRAEHEPLVKFSERQAAAGFPYLMEIATVRLWSILETAADEVLLHHLRKSPAARETPVVLSLKTTVGAFLGRSADDQHAAILELLKEKFASRLRRGARQFEDIFEAVGLAVPRDSNVAKQLLLLQQLRHVVVHRNGTVDRRFTDHCPFFPAAIGDRVAITRRTYFRLETAVYWYLMSLCESLLAADDEGAATTMREICRDLAQLVVKEESGPESHDVPLPLGAADDLA